MSKFLFFDILGYLEETDTPVLKKWFDFDKEEGQILIKDYVFTVRPKDSYIIGKIPQTDLNYDNYITIIDTINEG